MRVGSASEHNHGSCVPHHRSHAYSFRVEGPQQHPMWSDWNGRTRPVKGIGVAVLISTTEHVDQARGRICWLWLARMKAHEPLHSHRIECHRHIADDVLIA